MNTKIELNEQEINFLRAFAAKQAEGCKDNVGTMTPIHVVERRNIQFVSTDEGYADVWKCEELPGSYDCFNDLIDALNELPKYQASPLPCYEDAELEDINGYFIASHEDYCKAFSLEAYSGVLVTSYEPVAYFFILDEARRYMNEYQAHNCEDCRIYTRGLGYSNHGDLPVFRNLLMRLGTQLNDEAIALETAKMEILDDFDLDVDEEEHKPSTEGESGLW